MCVCVMFVRACVSAGVSVKGAGQIMKAIIKEGSQKVVKKISTAVWWYVCARVRA